MIFIYENLSQNIFFFPYKKQPFQWRGNNFNIFTMEQLKYVNF